MEETQVLGNGEKRRKTAKPHPESAFGWVPTGWALGRSLIEPRKVKQDVQKVHENVTFIEFWAFTFGAIFWGVQNNTFRTLNRTFGVPVFGALCKGSGQSQISAPSSNSLFLFFTRAALFVERQMIYPFWPTASSTEVDKFRSGKRGHYGRGFSLEQSSRILESLIRLISGE